MKNKTVYVIRYEYEIGITQMFWLDKSLDYINAMILKDMKTNTLKHVKIYSMNKESYILRKIKEIERNK